jgi:TPR repeat protein
MAEQGDDRAAFLLGMRFASGTQAIRDDSEAYRWFKQAADGGLAEAQYNLGILHATGRGTAPNYAEAARWYRLAAEQGLSEAQFNLGTLYSLGLGVDRDERLAVDWLTRAADDSLPEAQFNLGVLHEHGRGVRLNAPAALTWYERAAKQGFAPAATRLAALKKKLQAAGAPAADLSRQTPSAGASPTGTAGQSKAAASVLDRQSGGEGASAPDKWLDSLDANHYTLLILSDTNEAAVRRFVRKHFPGGNGGYYTSRRKGKIWYSVVHGEFATYALAKRAIKSLPPPLRKAKPWARKVGVIRDALKN